MQAVRLVVFSVFALLAGTRAPANPDLLPTQVAKLIASDATPGMQFAIYGVAVDDNHAFVGAPSALYVFDHVGESVWMQVKRIPAPSGMHLYQFSEDGNTLAVGWIGIQTGLTEVHIYDQNAGGAGNWGLVTTLADPDVNGSFGRSITLQNDTLIVGDPAWGVSPNSSGTVYVYERNAGATNGWGLTGNLYQPNPQANDLFGASAAILDDMLLVGAPGSACPPAPGPGKAYLFARSGSQSPWSFIKTFLRPLSSQVNNFGGSVALTDGLAVIGYDECNAFEKEVHFYARDVGGNGNWGLLQSVASNQNNSSTFGETVRAYGDLVAVAQWNTSPSGRTMLFARNEGGSENWGYLGDAMSPDASYNDRVNLDMNVSTTFLISSAPEDNNYSGAAYIFRLDGAPQACCQANGMCTQLSQQACTSIGGLAQGLGSWCAATRGTTFDNLGALSSDGWVTINRSSPVGSDDWRKGDPTLFPAFDGASTSYIAGKYTNCGVHGTISNWLLSPVLALTDDTHFSFYTRTESGSLWPDRLEIRLSTNGASTNVGNTADSVGDFSTLMLSINPALVQGGYPTTWTRYDLLPLGPGSGTTGRIAFRYFVTNAGPDDPNSDYIGIDSVTITHTPQQCASTCNPPDCNQHGTCTDGTCSCDPGWTGPDCGTPTQSIPTVSVWGMTSLILLTLCTGTVALRYRTPVVPQGTR